ncbi:MAG: hypothetical protein P8P29_05125 [Flavobacteriaceae bacterium]|nr:hypothetical protein [Flavobacteriaceae bacterium]
MKRPKQPKPTAEETALVTRQTMQLDKEIEEEERRLKAVRTGQLGSKSLLAKGSAKSRGSSAGAGTLNGGRTVSGGGMLRGGGSTSGSSAGSQRQR